MACSHDFELVQLRNGARSVYSTAFGEVCHPGLGPSAEAETLYVRQLDLLTGLRSCAGEFVIWDVGLGAAANVLTVLRAVRGISSALRVVSFDQSLESLRFARKHAVELGYFVGYELVVDHLCGEGSVRFDNGAQSVCWEAHLGDFPALIASPAARSWPSPHAILFDPFSPKRNPAMWTLPMFTGLLRATNPSRPCALATYSRSTMTRVALLLAGFFVGVGCVAGRKEETTVAATTLDLLREPLTPAWLPRARRSLSAEPLSEAQYRQAPLSDASWEALQRHPQFRQSLRVGETN